MALKQKNPHLAASKLRFDLGIVFPGSEIGRKAIHSTCLAFHLLRARFQCQIGVKMHFFVTLKHKNRYLAASKPHFDLGIVFPGSKLGLKPILNTLAVIVEYHMFIAHLSSNLMTDTWLVPAMLRAGPCMPMHIRLEP